MLVNMHNKNRDIVEYSIISHYNPVKQKGFF